MRVLSTKKIDFPHHILCDVPVTLWFALIVFSIICTGCNKYTKYRVLSFFFDGVPPLEETVGSEYILTNPDKPARDIKKFREEIEVTAGKTGVERKSYFHKPFREKACHECHNFALEKGKKKKGLPRFKSEGGEYAPLKYKRSELCPTCHKNKGKAYALENNLFMHGPVHVGACLFCHRPHVSRNSFLLRVSPPKKLCLQCHKSEDLQITAEHRGSPDTDCTKCHNPHMESSRYFLRPAYLESKKK